MIVAQTIWIRHVISECITSASRAGFHPTRQRALLVLYTPSRGRLMVAPLKARGDPRHMYLLEACAPVTP